MPSSCYLYGVRYLMTSCCYLYDRHVLPRHGDLLFEEIVCRSLGRPHSPDTRHHGYPGLFSSTTFGTRTTTLLRFPAAHSHHFRFTIRRSMEHKFSVFEPLAKLCLEWIFLVSHLIRMHFIFEQWMQSRCELHKGRGRVLNTRASCSECWCFKSRPGDRLDTDSSWFSSYFQKGTWK